MKDKIAVVTGGTKGVGRAIAAELLRGGAKVFICARNAAEIDETIDELGTLGEVRGTVCDVRSAESVEATLAECRTVFGGVDILINNAGIGIMGKTVEEITPAEFAATLETNLFGAYYSCHFAIPMMRERGGGYIINISSLAGQNAHPKMAAYNASKFALNGFTEAMMQEVRPYDIKVSLICPGSINTDFGGHEASAAMSWKLQPDDIAAVVADLLKYDQRSLPSKIEMRPSKPPQK